MQCNSGVCYHIVNPLFEDEIDAAILMSVDLHACTVL